VRTSVGAMLSTVATGGHREAAEQSLRLSCQHPEPNGLRFATDRGDPGRDVTLLSSRLPPDAVRQREQPDEWND
jgi:hypothetical protein